jgi:hypothetical protein
MAEELVEWKVFEVVEKMVSRMAENLVVLTVEWKESLLVGKMEVWKELMLE